MPGQPRSEPSSLPPDRRAVRTFLLLSVAVAAAVAGYAVYSRRAPAAPGHAGVQPLDDSSGLEALGSRPRLLFRNTLLGPSYGRVAVVALDDPEGRRYATPLACDRVHAARGSGLCLQASRGVLTTYKALRFDDAFQVGHAFNLAGAPSRTRTSPDGTHAASTVFVSGDSYSSNSFSTRTTIYDLRAGAELGDLEQFHVVRNGEPFKAANFNFWGVTFTADGDGFYATLGSGGALYLVRGTASGREVQVVREGIECPSLSPDGTHLVYKSRALEGGRRVWHLRVVDLRTNAEVAINEPHSVDDQAEWLDNDRVLYGLPRDIAGSGTSDIWVARADGSAPSRVFVRDASSPAVVR